MAEYVKKEDVVDVLRNLWHTKHNGNPVYSAEIDRAITDVYDLEPEDVVPVRHCGWVLVEKGPERDIYRCPWCGRIIATMFVESEVARQFPYCHCGTKMDRGDDL